MKANEQSEFCAPSGFVPKKSGKLRFVIDFTALNKYVQGLVHLFPSSDQAAQSIKALTTHLACVDFPSGYFQARLHPDSQRYTAFNTEFSRYLFLTPLRDSQVQVTTLIVPPTNSFQGWASG